MKFEKIKPSPAEYARTTVWRVYQNPNTKMYLEVTEKKKSIHSTLSENVAFTGLVPVYGALPYNRNASLTRNRHHRKEKGVVVMERRIFFHLIMRHFPPCCWGLQHFHHPMLEAC